MPRKADEHVPVLLMPRGPPLPTCALFYKTKPPLGHQPFLFAAADGTPSSPCQAPRSPLTLLDFQRHFGSGHGEKPMLLTFSPVTRHETCDINSDFNRLCPTLLLPADVCELCLPAEKTAACPGCQGGQWDPGVHQEQCSQQVEGGSPPPLLCPGEAPSAVLCPVLGSPVQER